MLISVQGMVSAVGSCLIVGAVFSWIIVIWFWLRMWFPVASRKKKEFIFVGSRGNLLGGRALEGQLLVAEAAAVTDVAMVGMKLWTVLL